MKSHTAPEFRKRFATLPPEVRAQARAAFRLFQTNPRHPGLHFKHVHGSNRLVAARVGRSYRAVGLLVASDEVVWFWIGPHDEYEKVLKALA
ncbi:MAG: hypothetical protein M3P29_07540 [Acidobacteriota bacterium]|nr:hypothetical protein [Acidobacteriota bacterium]